MSRLTSPAYAVRVAERGSGRKRAAVGCLGEGIAAGIHQRHEGGDSMTTAMAKPGNTSDTFLVHYFGGGLADERYVVERYKAYVAHRIMLRSPWIACCEPGGTLV